MQAGGKKEMGRGRVRERGNDGVRNFWDFFLSFGGCQKHVKGVGLEQKQKNKRNIKNQKCGKLF